MSFQDSEVLKKQRKLSKLNKVLVKDCPKIVCDVPHKLRTQRTERELSEKCGHKLMSSDLVYLLMLDSTTTSL